ncbi:MAG: MFS transporter [Endozoicomonas sp.]
MTVPESPEFRRILPAMAAIFVDVLSYGLITPLIVAAFAGNVFLAGNPGLQTFAQSLAFALFPLGMFIGAATLGDISDRWGRRKTLMLCMAGITFAFSAMALSLALGSVTLFLLARLASGLLGGSVAIGQAAIIDLSTENTKALNLSRITIANACAHFLGPGIGALLADRGLYLPFICISFMAITTLLWIAFSLKETRLPVQGCAIDWLRPLRVFSEAFTDQKIRRLSLAYLLFHSGNSMSYQFFYIYLAEEHHYSPGDLSLFSTLAMGLGALAATLWALPLLQKRFDSLQLSFVPLILCGLLTVIFQSDVPMLLRWCLSFIWALALVVAYVSTLILYSSCVDEERQGWVMGIAGSVFAFSFIIGGLSASLLNWLSVNTLMVLSGVLLAASGLLLKTFCHPAARQ